MRIIAIVTLVAGLSISVFGQGGNDKAAKIEKRSEILTQKMDSALSLSAEQKTKVLELNTIRFNSMADARKIENEDARKAEMRSLMQKYNEALKGILSEEQNKKFVEIRKALMQESKEKKGEKKRNK